MSAVPDISVVLSVHNGAADVWKSAESVLAQEGVALELIIVDDGSTDDTPAILDELARSDGRVRVLSQPHAGITAGLIHGCANAEGRHIARQDAGDCTLPRRLALQHAALEADRELSFVSCWTEVCGPHGEFLSIEKGSGHATGPRLIISEREIKGVIDGPSSHGSVMFSRDRYRAAGGYRPQFYFGQDWDLWYRLAEAGKFQMIDSIGYRSVVTPGSLSGRYVDAQNAIAKLAHQALLCRRRGEAEDDVLARAEGIRPGREGALPTRTEADGFYFIGERLRRNGDDRAQEYFRKSIAAAPHDLRAWLRLMQLKAAQRVRAGRRAHPLKAR